MALPAEVVAVFDAEAGVGEAALCAATTANIASNSNIDLTIDIEEAMMVILCWIACAVCTGEKVRVKSEKSRG